MSEENQEIIQPNEQREDRHPLGGFVHRSMPPTDWYAGAIPEACYDKTKTRGQIEDILAAEYKKPENLKRLVEWLEWRDHGPQKFHELEAKVQLEMLASIDADTVWVGNNITGERIEAEPESERVPQELMGYQALKNIGDNK